MHTIIIDDEIAAIENLQIMLNKYCKNINIVATAQSADEGVLLINKENPDLIFLDIEMPHTNGFDLLKRFPNPTFSVIFTTAYNQYAIQAIKFSALDYLLKPIDVDELITAVSKVEDKSKIDDERLNVLLKNIDTKTTKRLALPKDGGYSIIKVETIIRCEASDNYTTFYIKDKKPILVSRTLKEFENMLPKDNFLRVHQSHLINIDKVEEYYKTDGAYVLMEDGSTVSISRRKREEFEKLFF
jgi:two-component system LytT family response regulator